MNAKTVEGNNLIAESSVHGNLMLSDGHRDGKCLFEIDHFFNDQMQELGYIAFRHDALESVHRFNPPRLWGPESLRRLRTHRLP